MQISVGEFIALHIRERRRVRVDDVLIYFSKLRRSFGRKISIRFEGKALWLYLP